jgi:hypothetical protein
MTASRNSTSFAGTLSTGQTEKLSNVSNDITLRKLPDIFIGQYTLLGRVEGPAKLHDSQGKMQRENPSRAALKPSLLGCLFRRIRRGIVVVMLSSLPLSATPILEPNGRGQLKKLGSTRRAKLFFRFALGLEVNESWLVGVIGNELAIGNREFNDVDRSSPAVFSEVKPPGTVSAHNHIAVTPQQRFILHGPVQTILRIPDAHAIPPAIRDEPILTLPMKSLRTFAVVISDGGAFGLPVHQVRAVRVA